jgi:hypothetical protein
MHAGSHHPSVMTHDAASSPKDSVQGTVLPAETREELQLPRYSTRGTAPGLRGCWATNRQGEPCGAARRADSDYCNAHSGHGVTSDPKKWSAIGIARNSELRRRRATLRATLGISRSNTPRGVLKAMAYAEAEQLALAALDGAISSEIPAQSRASHALKLIDAVDPLTQVSTQISLPANPEGVESLSLSQLLSIAEQQQITIDQP